MIGVGPGPTFYDGREDDLPRRQGDHWMTRRLLIALCLLAVPLAAAPSADAAKRKVPRGFFGTIFDGDVRSGSPTLVDQEFGLMATSGVESVRTNFFWGEVQPSRGTTTFASTDPIVRETRAARAAAAARGDRRSAVGPQVPGQGGLPAQAGGRLHRLPVRPGQALRPEGHVLDREPDGAQAPDPRVADLERAQPALPVGAGQGPGVQAGRPGLRQAAARVAEHPEEDRPAGEGRARRAHQRLLDRPRPRSTPAAASRVSSTSRP